LRSATGVPIDSTYADQDFAVLAHDLLADQSYTDKVIVICWHHGHIPALAAEWKTPAGSFPDPWGAMIFNLVLPIDYDAHGRATAAKIDEPF
jgi:hypothetical protein